MPVPISKNTVFAWIVGLIFGSFVLHVPMYKSQWSLFNKSDTPSPFHSHAHSHRDLQDAEGPEKILVFHEKNDSFHKDEDLVASKLAEKVRVLCWISTHPENHKRKVSYNIQQNKPWQVMAPSPPPQNECLKHLSACVLPCCLHACLHACMCCAFAFMFDCLFSAHRWTHAQFDSLGNICVCF